MASVDQREQWLVRAMPLVTELFKDNKYEVPDNIRVSCGWPSKLGLGMKTRRIGECWDKTCTTDDHWQIFISPVLDDPSRVLDILIHEVVHVVVGVKAGHRKPFSDCAKSVGLLGPWTKTTAGEPLKEILTGWIEEIGPYPHGALKPSAVAKKAEPTRCLLMECVCGVKIRTTAKWMDVHGYRWPCPCGGELVNEDGDDDGEE